jgi:hypothetical protein
MQMMISTTQTPKEKFSPALAKMSDWISNGINNTAERFASIAGLAGKIQGCEDKLTDDCRSLRCVLKGGAG